MRKFYLPAIKVSIFTNLLKNSLKTLIFCFVLINFWYVKSESIWYIQKQHYISTWSEENWVFSYTFSWDRTSFSVSDYCKVTWIRTETNESDTIFGQGSRGGGAYRSQVTIRYWENPDDIVPIICFYSSMYWYNAIYRSQDIHSLENGALQRNLTPRNEIAFDRSDNTILTWNCNWWGGNRFYHIPNGTDPSVWNLYSRGDLSLSCNLIFKESWKHTITIEDPLYKKSSPNFWQITQIKVWLSGTYYTPIKNSYWTTIQNYPDTPTLYDNDKNAEAITIDWLPQLKILDLSNNKITSTSFLKNTQHNDSLEYINLTNNPITSTSEQFYVKIQENTTLTPSKDFKRFWYSYKETSPKYKREIRNNQNEITKSWIITGTNGRNEINNINIWNNFQWKFRVSILNDNSEAAYDEIDIQTENNWSTNIYTVTFDSNWWSTIQQQNINEWWTANRPSNPTKDWYTFKWRYTDSSLTNEYNFSSPITKDLILYAKREKISESIKTYNLTINYRYINWNTATGTFIKNYEAWSNYSITSPSIPGYTAIPNIVSWNIWNSDKTENVIYIANSESTQLYTLTINHICNWTKIAESETRSYAAWAEYYAYPRNIPGYTPNRTVVSWIMPNWNNSIDITYSKDSTWQGWITVVDNSSDLSLKVSNKYPDVDEWVRLTINVNEKYTWKIEFSKLQYYNGVKRTTISNTSSSYISDYSDELDDGYVKFNSSDDWSITISRFVKFSRSGKFKIYAEDIYWESRSIQINVWDYDDDSSLSSSSSDDSNLTLSANPTNPNINESINLTIKTDNYAGKIDLYAKYRDPTSSYRTTINNNSIEYFSDYSNVWENGYYKMTSSDKGKKTLSNLVEFKKPWTYRIYAEDKNWYSNFIQIYVNENGSISSSSQNDDEIQRLLNELLNKSDNSDLGTSTNTTNLSTDNNSYTDTNEEVYISRSCKKYRIQYNAWLWVFTSPDLKKAEYFINKDYFKRYIDSKNKQVDGCPTNIWWISTNYNDTSNSSSKYTAPNGKVYFINQESWWYKSNELEKEINAKKNFWSITDLKYFIRDRNPLINMDKVK